MENLQKLMPKIEELLGQWYQLTLQNQEYATFLAVSVWLVVAILYSIRIGFLKRDTNKIIKAKQELQAQLDTANQQIEALQQELIQAGERMTAAEQAAEAAEQRAAETAQRLQRSNQQLAGSVASLVDCFELSQAQLPKADSDNLLPEYEAIIARVAERFQNEQQAKTQLQLSLHAESAKHAEKEMLITSLQHRLDTQTQQLAKLELSIEQYEQAQQQLEIDKQAIAAAAENQKRLAEQARQRETAEALTRNQTAVAASVVKVESVATPLPVTEVRTPEPAPIATPKPADTNPIPPEPVPVAKRAVSVKPDTDKSEPEKAGKLKGMFGRAMDKINRIDEKLGFQNQAQPVVEENRLEQPLVTPRRVEPEVVVPEIEAEKTPVAEKLATAAEDITAKFGSMFSGRKNKTVASESQPPAAVEPLVEPAEPEPAKKAGKLSGMFGKFGIKK